MRCSLIIAEMLPEIMKLPRSERFKLAQLLLEDLASEELNEPFRNGQVFPIHTPTYSPTAASELAQVLAQLNGVDCFCQSLV